VISKISPEQFYELVDKLTDNRNSRLINSNKEILLQSKLAKWIPVILDIQLQEIVENVDSVQARLD
jgi:cytidylate kinase